MPTATPAMKLYLKLILLFLLASCKNEGSQEVIPAEKPPVAVAVRTDNVFMWDTENCKNTGRYNTGKYTVKQLEDTYTLWYTYRIIPFIKMLAKPEELYTCDATARRREVNRAYYKTKKVFDSLQLVPADTWIGLLKSRQRQLEESYQLALLDAEAPTNPEVLLNNRFCKHCSEYAAALTTTDTVVLLDEWQKLVDKTAKNRTKGKYYERYRKERASADRFAYARIALLKYGWHNCANQYVYHGDPDKDYSFAFDKLFINVKSECEE